MKLKIPLRRAVPPLLALTSAALLLIFPAEVSAAALDAMTLSVRRLVPLLFPYTVLSVLVVRRGWTPPAGGIVRFLRLPREAGGILVTGWTAGFPVGAGGAAELYGTGRISRTDAERLAAVSSVPSPAFLVGAAGGMRGDPRFGWFLWILSVLTAAVLSRLSGRGTVEKQSGPLPSPPLSVCPFSSDLSRAVTDAAFSCLSVTAFVVFFRVLCAVGETLVPPLSPVLTLTAELSAAVRFASSVPGVAGAALTGVAVGFGSVSVLGQIGAKTAAVGLRLSVYLRSRLILAAVLSVGAAAYAAVRPLPSAAPAFSGTAIPAELLLSALTLLALVPDLLPDSRE